MNNTQQIQNLNHQLLIYQTDLSSINFIVIQSWKCWEMKGSLSIWAAFQFLPQSQKTSTPSVFLLQSFSLSLLNSILLYTLNLTNSYSLSMNFVALFFGPFYCSNHLFSIDLEFFSHTYESNAKYYSFESFYFSPFEFFTANSYFIIESKNLSLLIFAASISIQICLKMSYRTKAFDPVYIFFLLYSLFFSNILHINQPEKVYYEEANQLIYKCQMYFFSLEEIINFVQFQFNENYFLQILQFKNFYNIEMQKSNLFQSLNKKKQMIERMSLQSKTISNKQQFKHFQGISQPTLMKAESNAMYLAHLNGQFRDQLREFVHQQQSYRQTKEQLNKITENLENQIFIKQKQNKIIKKSLSQNQIQKQGLQDKSKMLLQKIFCLQEKIKSCTMREEQQDKMGINLQEEIEFQKQVLQQIKSRNNQLIQKLQIKSVQIQNETASMENKEKHIKSKQTLLKKCNSQIDSMYSTLQDQDNSLQNLCSNIESALNKQNNHINDIQFIKNDLQLILGQSKKRKEEISNAQNTQDSLLNYLQDLTFDVKRVEKQLQIQEKGIDEQYWKIEKQKSRLEQNQQMLIQLKQYLQKLINKNEMMQKVLQQQVIQDYTIKKIVESKCSQPVGKKTKLFLQQIQDKQLRSTKSSFKQNNETGKKRFNCQIIKSPKKCTQPMKFIFEKLLKQKPQNYHSRQQQQYYEELKQQLYEKQRSRLSNTGISFINNLTKFQISH